MPQKIKRQKQKRIPEMVISDISNEDRCELMNLVFFKSSPIENDLHAHVAPIRCSTHSRPLVGDNLCLL